MLTVASKLYVSCTHTPTLSFLSSSLSDFFLYTSPTIGTGFLGILNTADIAHIVFVVGLSGVLLGILMIHSHFRYWLNNAFSVRPSLTTLYKKARFSPSPHPHSLYSLSL